MKKSRDQIMCEYKQYNAILTHAHAHADSTHADTRTDADSTHADTRTDTDRKTAFDRAKRTVEKMYMAYTTDRNTDTEKAYTTAVYNLAIAVVYSVMRTVSHGQYTGCVVDNDTGTVYNKGQSYNVVVDNMRKAIRADYNALTRAIENPHPSYDITYTKNGNEKRTLNADCTQYVNASLSRTIDDGLDLVHTAAVAIMELATDFGNALLWLDTPHPQKTLARHIYTDPDHPLEYKTVELRPIQVIYRTVRAAIIRTRAVVTDPRSGYSYIADIDPVTRDYIYYRSGLYCDLGTDSTGRAHDTTADIRSVNRLIDSLQLTAKQAVALKYRLRGYSYEVAAKKCGITVDSYKDRLEGIKKKAIALGYLPSETATAYWDAVGKKYHTTGKPGKDAKKQETVPESLIAFDRLQDWGYNAVARDSR